MGRPKKFTKGHVLSAIKDSGGLKTEICQRIGCARKTFDAYIKEDIEIADAYEDECNTVSDMARGALFEAIEQRQPWAVMFYLDRKDPEYQRRGKTEVSGEVKTSGGVIVVPAPIEEEEWERAVMQQQKELFEKHG